MDDQLPVKQLKIASCFTQSEKLKVDPARKESVAALLVQIEKTDLIVGKISLFSSKVL